jgi:hypothetical protein
MRGMIFIVILSRPQPSFFILDFPHDKLASAS